MWEIQRKEKVLISFFLAVVSIFDRRNLYRRSDYSPVVRLGDLFYTGFLQVVVE